VNLEVKSPRRQLTADELEHSERYALVAWGISEKIRIGRHRAGLSIRQLAAACEIDAAQLSRIENGSSASNISLEGLLRIARCLGLEIQQLLSTEFIDDRNPFKIEEIDRAPQPGVGQPVLCIPQDHFLHVNHWNVPEGKTIRPEEEREDSRAYRSWIVLEGEAIFELADPISGTTKELIDRDSVIHCRHHAALISIHALQNLKLLQVAYSPHCSDARDDQ
jgi:transcriptional regulator with XRE-family HTH domain